MKLSRFLLPCLILLSACSTKTTQTNDHSVNETFIEDSTGRVLSLDKNPEAVIVLSSSLADLWITAGGRLAGTTDDAFDRDLEISKEHTQVIGSIKDPNAEAIVAMEPDLIILTEDIAGHQALVPILSKTSFPYFIAKVETFDDYLFVLRQFTTLTGQADRYTTYGEAVKTQIDELFSSLPSQPASQPTYLFLRAHSSGVKVIARDHVAIDILTHAGAVNIAESDASLLNDLSLEVILEKDPDFIFVITMGSDSDKALQALKESLAAQPAWGQLTAVQNGRVTILPKELFHYKPNRRWGEAYAYMLKILYPDSYAEE